MTTMGSSTESSTEHMTDWIGREYWTNPATLPDEPVRTVDVSRYASALGDASWLARRPGVCPPGFMEVASPNYRNYHVVGGEEFLRTLLPFTTPWGEAWTPMMLVRHETWTVRRAIRIGETLAGRSVITNVTWRKATDDRVAQLAVEFTKDYRVLTEEGEEPVGTVVWDMVFVADPLPGEDVERNWLAAEPDLSASYTPDCAVGDTIGRYTRTMDMEAMIRWSCAINDMGLPHIDPDYARRVYGVSHGIVHGPFINASMARLVTDWLPDSGRIITHRARFLRPVLGEHRLTFTGDLAGLESVAGRPQASLTVTATNQYGDIVARAETRCSLGA